MHPETSSMVDFLMRSVSKLEAELKAARAENAAFRAFLETQREEYQESGAAAAQYLDLMDGPVEPGK